MLSGADFTTGDWRFPRGWPGCEEMRMPSLLWAVMDLKPTKKAPLTFQSRTLRQPSPRTANHESDIRIHPCSCKCHLGNGLSGSGGRESDALKHMLRQPAGQRGGYCFCQVRPPLSVIQTSAVEVDTLPFCGSGNSRLTMSPVRVAPAEAGVTCVQWVPASEE